MRGSVACAELGAQQDSVLIRWHDGVTAEFPGIWLRDNLPQDRDPHSGQRLIDVTDLPRECRIRSLRQEGETLQILWQDSSPPTSFSLAFLHRHRAPQRYPELTRRYWLEGSRLDAQRDFARLGHASLKADPMLRQRWLARLLQDGIAFLAEVEPVEAGLLDAVAPLGRVAETNYGRVFDVRAVAQPENLAYTDAGLGLHTDNPYREPVPGFQALHTLVAAPDGGESLFADGFALAEHLRECAPEQFALLTRTPVPFHFSSAGADLYAERPLIALDCAGAVAAVHYNSRSIAPLVLPPAQCRDFYAAYRAFGELLRAVRFQLRTRLAAGDLVVFDNQRILHGRTGFAAGHHPRHLRGCYLTRDSVYSEAALLRRRSGEEHPR